MFFRPSLAVVVAAVTSWFFLRALIPSLSSSLLDQPNERSSHRHPTPRGGGLVFVLVGCVASALALLISDGSASATLPILVSPWLALPLALVGFLDDRHKLPSTLRYCVQLATASVVVLMSPLVSPSVLGLPVIVVLMIAVTAVINFTNFMDGVDGLVAGCMSVLFTTAAIHLAAPLPIWTMVGALLGFLLWNWSPANVFMGDVGSTFLGAVFAMLVLHSSTWSEALALMLVATPLLGDAFFCVLRRLIAGQHVFQAHRLHLFQRLHQAGWTHARVSSLYIAATAVLAIADLCGGWPCLITFSAFELLIGIWLDQQIAVPFAVASRS
jgi:Fuc2NAc and GlcNAc transferase